MTLLLTLLAQALHTGLVLLAAPTLAGCLAWTEARLAGHAGPPWHAPWNELARLLRKQPVVSETASPLFTAAPLACFAVTAVAASLAPSFTLGMAFAPLADLLVLAGLLAVARTLPVLAALEDGGAPGALAVRQTLSLTLYGEPALLMLIFALGLAAGTTNLDLIAGLQRARLLQPLAAIALAAAALVLLALVQRDTGMPEEAGFSGSGLALLRMADALRLVFWLDLTGALFLPFGMARAMDFPAGWIVGLLSWVLRLGLFTLLLAGFRVAAGRLPARRMPALLGMSLLLAALAVLLVLARMRPV